MTAMTGDKGGGVIRDPPPAPIGWLNISAQIGLTLKNTFYKISNIFIYCSGDNCLVQNMN